MPIAYAPGSLRVNALFTAASVTSWCQQVRDYLVNNCGWTVVSGAIPDTTLQSATAASGLGMRLRIRVDGNSGVFTPIAEDGSITGFDFRVNAAGSATVNWRIIANQYQMMVLIPGISANTDFNIVADGGCFFFTGSVAIPTFLNGVVTRGIFATSNGTPYFGNGWNSSFRNTPTLAESACYFWVCFNGNQFGSDNLATPRLGSPRLVVPASSQINQRVAIRWHDNSYLISEPFFAAATTGVLTDEAKYWGQIWDGAWITDSRALPPDTTAVFDGRTFYNVMNNDLNNANQADGSLLLVVP